MFWGGILRFVFKRGGRKKFARNLASIGETHLGASEVWKEGRKEVDTGAGEKSR